MAIQEETTVLHDETLKLVGHITAAYVGNNPVPVGELPGLIKSIHSTLGGLVGSSATQQIGVQKPAVAIKKSITPEFIICLEDGKKLKMLKRYLRTRFGMSPEDYRSKWSLPSDYPMVAPAYAAQRSEFAKKIGLGRSSPGRGGKKAKPKKRAAH